MLEYANTKKEAIYVYFEKSVLSAHPIYHKVHQ